MTDKITFSNPDWAGTEVQLFSTLRPMVELTTSGSDGTAPYGFWGSTIHSHWGKNALLMSKVKEKCLDWFELTAS